VTIPATRSAGDTAHASVPAVLVVDDDPATGAMVASLAGDTHPVFTAANEAEAAAVLQASPIGVMLCSEYLQRQPGGLQLLAQTRAGHPHTQLVLISESGAEELLTVAINDIGVLQYLRRPIDPALVSAAVALGLRHHCKSVEIEQLQRSYREMARQLRGLPYRVRRVRQTIRVVMAYGRDLTVASATTLIVVQLMFLGVGSVVFLALYALKSTLGFDLFEDLHLQDLLGG
jgi:two-component system response regulator HupR/HoxA